MRKVKCDEGRPACQRCVSAGRICRGYGIWGGGSNHSTDRQLVFVNSGSALVHVPESLSLLVVSAAEQDCLDWFKRRTVNKLQATFMSGFWNVLLFQASFDEPAVLNAVLALSSWHKGGTTSIENRSVHRPTYIPPNGQESFTLQHYVKAIGLLEPHFLAHDKASLRVALITCLMFISLDLLRGHFETARLHLRNGLSILKQLQILFSGKDAVLRLDPLCELTDSWIAEAFSRFHLQFELFDYTHHHSGLCLQIAGPGSFASPIQSLKQAWEQLELLLHRIFQLAHQSRHWALSEKTSCLTSPDLIDKQRNIQSDLAAWLERYNAFENTRRKQWTVMLLRVYQILCGYHALAKVMVATCLHPDDELVYDSSTADFTLLLEHLAGLKPEDSVISHRGAAPGVFMDMSHSIMDVGWIPPLFYTAVKCRVHRLRLHAISLLELSAHREGLWDSVTAACVARKVMNIEEREFYAELAIVNDPFPTTSSARPVDLMFPTIPRSYRLNELEIVLSGAPMDRIELYCKRRLAGGERQRTLLSEFDVNLQKWMDARSD